MDALLDCSNRGDLVLDLFLGSGRHYWRPNAPAALATPSNSIRFQVDTAIRRWQNLTGRDARRVSDSKTFREIEAEAEQTHDR
jgi:hypothetical protein